MFGALSAPQVFHWGDMYMGEQITCTGRQYLRQMIGFFMKRGYETIGNGYGRCELFITI
jgi:DNA polymerase elongation subunit (family B)